MKQKTEIFGLDVRDGSVSREERLKDLLLEALDVDVASRIAFIDGHTTDDDALRTDLIALIDAHDRAGEFMSGTTPIEADAVRHPDDTPLEEPGTLIGRYRLVRLLGEGGFGRVYLAEQQEPITRAVALKIIKAGMDTRHVIARFEAERQALAMMDHPGIARVIDAGAAPGGRPYFVMELVDGVPINKYCDEHHLSITARLDLFSQVCAAVQHAHTKGIIHRDVKPSNVLVARRGEESVPKVIDFGIAKAVSGRTTQTLATERLQLLGTPEYMSPEQADTNAADIDTRTDVYSLGVVLYELLTGVTPLDVDRVRTASLGQVQRMICEEEAPRPSTRLSTSLTLSRIAANRAADPWRLVAQIDGDLDWIVLKAVEKDRERRYGSAADLARDVARFLKHEPVMAGPQDVAYRVRKFVRRNRASVVAAALIVLALVGGVIGTAIGLWRATLANERMVVESAKAARIADFTQQMLSGIDPVFADGKDTQLLRIILETATARIGTELAGQREVESAIRATIGDTYVALGLYDEAKPMYERALALQLEMHGGTVHADPAYRTAPGDWGPPQRDVATCLRNLGTVRRAQGDYAGAEPLLREALRMRRELFGPDHHLIADSLETISLLLENTGEYSEAESSAREALDMTRRILGDEHVEVASCLNTLGHLVRASGNYVEAESLLRQALDMRVKLLGDEHLDVAKSKSTLGTLLRDKNDSASAVPFYRDALAVYRRVLGDDHHRVAEATNNLAMALDDMGDSATAEPLLRESLRIRRLALGDDHAEVAVAMDNLAMVLKAKGDYDAAEEMHRESLAMRRKLLGDRHPDVAIGLNNLAALLVITDDHAGAVPLYREALDINRAILGRDHPYLAPTLHGLAQSLLELKRYPEAEQVLGECVPIVDAMFADDHPQVWLRIDTHCMLGIAIAHQGRFDEAEPMLLDALARFKVVSAPVRNLRSAISEIIALYEAWGKPAEAEQYRPLLQSLDDA